MSQSFVTQVVEQETRYIGNTPIYDGPAITILNPNPFIFNVNIGSQIPLPERTVIDLTVSGQSGSDINGVIYSGQFRIRRNSNNGTPSIVVTGDNLTDIQISTIRSSMSIIENVSANGLDSIATLDMSLTQIARNGARFFNVIIPYDDDNVTTPTNSIVIPFLEMDASNRDPSYVNHIYATIDNGELSIDAGPIPRSASIFTISPNFATSRNITYLSIAYEPILNTGNITISYTENLANQEGIRIIPNNIPSLPSTDGNITTRANYNFRIYTQFWKNRTTGIPSNVYRDTQSKLYYNIQYGIGSVTGNAYSPEPMFGFGIYVGNSATVTFNTDSIFYSMTISANDTGAANRRPFTIENRYTSPFTRIALSIDRLNSANNSFIIQGYINGSPTSMNLSGFSNDLTIADFLSLVQDTLRTQYAAWYNDPSNPIPTGLVFHVDTKYSFGNTGDLSNVDVSNIVPGSTISNSFFLVPLNVGTSFTLTTDLYNHATGVDMSFQDFFNWLRRNFGSFGLYFRWDIPDLPDWKNLKVYPIIVNSTTANGILFNQGILTPYNFFSITNCFINKIQNSTKGDEINYTSPSNPALYNGRDVITIDSSVTNLLSFANLLATKLNTVITNIWNDPYNRLPPQPVVSTVVPDYYVSLNPNNYINYTTTFSPGPFGSYSSFISPAFYNFYNYYQNPSIQAQSIPPGDSSDGTFSKVFLANTLSPSPINIPVTVLNNIGQLIDIINDPTNPTDPNHINNLIRASLTDPSYSALDQSTIDRIEPWNILPVSSGGLGTLYVNANINTPIVRRYSFSRYTTLQDLVDAINSDWLNNISVSVDPATNLHSDASPSHLVSPITQDITVNPLPKIFNGTVSSIQIPVIPSANVELMFDVAFADTIGGGSSANTYGVQVALGGYERNGVFFANNAPNTFAEPIYNSVFPINFTTINADVIYLLIRTRVGVSLPVYTSVVSNYSGMVRYNNGYSPYNITPYLPTDTRFTNAWNQGGTLGIPTVVAIPVFSTVMDVSIEDTFIFDSINLKITNKPAALDKIGFLAINRTNNTQSQTESKVATTFGLVLDNRGSWDVLISPEASLTKNPSGDIAHLGLFYERTVFNDDEGYDFVITTSLPDAVQNSISISPVPGNPQVWVLRLEYGVKSYLASLIAQSNSCSLDIDFLITGRSTGVAGTARVSVYYDYTCVYDIGLCDFFWNLIDPPKPAGPEIIQNRLSFTYQTLVDCGNLTTAINENVAINAPILISILNIPTFKNGNGLLLVKSSYTPEVQGFYYPTGNELDPIQFADCSAINLNLPLIQRLNKEFLLLPNQDNPINDISQIRSLLNTADSYLWVKPQFHFPPDDSIKDCDANEIVLVGIGYVFKNWSNGTRQDDVLIGANLLFPQGVFSSPEMNICYRYYYNQSET